LLPSIGKTINPILVEFVPDKPLTKLDLENLHEETWIEAVQKCQCGHKYTTFMPQQDTDKHVNAEPCTQCGHYMRKIEKTQPERTRVVLVRNQTPE
jgi:Zn ribbon nucleic-acid-binding protein